MNTVSVELQFPFFLFFRLVVDGRSVTRRSDPRGYSCWIFKNNLYMVESQSGYIHEDIIYVIDGDFSSIPTDDYPIILKKPKKLICSRRSNNPVIWDIGGESGIEYKRTFWQDEWYLNGNLVMWARLPYRNPLKLLRGTVYEASICAEERILIRLIGILFVSYCGW